MVRVKNRYLCFEVQFRTEAERLSGEPTTTTSNQHTFPQLNTRSMMNIVRDQIELNFGDAGAGLVLGGCTVKYFNPRTRMGILKAPRDHYQMVWSALTLTTQIRNQPCLIRVWHASGTIKKAQRAAIGVDRKLLLAWSREQKVRSKRGIQKPLEINDPDVNELLKNSETEIKAVEM